MTHDEVRQAVRERYGIIAETRGNFPHVLRSVFLLLIFETVAYENCAENATRLQTRYDQPIDHLSEGTEEAIQAGFLSVRLRASSVCHSCVSGFGTAARHLPRRPNRPDPSVPPVCRVYPPARWRGVCAESRVSPAAPGSPPSRMAVTRGRHRSRHAGEPGRLWQKGPFFMDLSAYRHSYDAAWVCSDRTLHWRNHNLVAILDPSIWLGTLGIASSAATAGKKIVKTLPFPSRLLTAI